MAGPDDKDDHDDRKVKDLLDPAMRADLERWFQLPSYDQVADQGGRPELPSEDADVVEFRKRAAEAVAAIDPALLEAYERRLALRAAVLKPVPPLVVPTIGMLDLEMIARQHRIAEPREYERSPEIEDELRVNAPQALLRDLHRPDQTFDKVFEISDPSAAQRFNGAAVVEQIMATDWRLRSFAMFANENGRIAFEEMRSYRRQPWAELKLTREAVTE